MTRAVADRPVKIIGVGNPLMGDDGVGIAVIERLRRLEPLPGIQVIDAGTGGLVLLDILDRAAGAVLVDAADLGQPPGTVRRLAGADLRPRPGAPTLSLHHAGLADTLALGGAMGPLPHLALFLVQAQQCQPGAGLSPPVAGALEDLAVEVLAEARSMVR